MYKLVNTFNLTGGNSVRYEPYLAVFGDKLLPSRINLIEEELVELITATSDEERLKEACDVLVVTYGLLGFAGVESKDGVKPREPSSLSSSYKDLQSAISMRLFRNMVSACENIIYMAKVNIKELGVDPDIVFKEVCVSNMSKFVKIEDEHIAIESCAKITREGRYKSPQYRKSPDSFYWVIYDNDTDKILKSCEYKKPDMHQFLRDTNLIM